MPIRFSTEAANADHLRPDGEPEGMSGEVGADGTPRDRGQARRHGEKARDEQPAGEPARPGKDAQSPGVVKEKDAGKP